MDHPYYDVFLEAVRRDGLKLGNVPPEFRTQEMCLEAVKQNGSALQFIDEAEHVCAYYEAAVISNGLALSLVPPKMRTPELCKLAIASDPDAIEYVPGFYFGENCATNTDSNKVAEH